MNAVVEHTPPQPKSAYEQLPRRYRRFVDAWIEGKTGVEAIKAAGYKRLYPHQASAKLRNKPEIQAAIEERTRQYIADVGVRHETVIRELYWLATCDPRKLVNGEGVQIPLHLLPADIAACISSVEIENVSYNDETGTRYKYKFWDKNKALEKLGLYLKLWETSKTNVNVDARSVTNNVIAGPEALSGALRLLEQARTIAAPATAALSHTDGSVLPAEIRDESPGRGAPVDAGKGSRSSGAT
jgi:hypothetical protein